MNSATLHEALSIVNQLSEADQHALLEHLQQQLDDAVSDDWALQGAQLAFMMQHHDLIAAAYAEGDLSRLDPLESSEEYRALFEDMPWDEAYDRYEETWWVDDDEATA